MRHGALTRIRAQLKQAIPAKYVAYPWDADAAGYAVEGIVLGKERYITYLMEKVTDLVSMTKDSSNN